MTDMELAEEIALKTAGGDNARLTREQWDQIIAALRRAELSQTEIKGHMRIEDDLKAELAEVKADLVDEAPARFQLQAALERAQTKWQEAQIRIAALEKELETLRGKHGSA